MADVDAPSGDNNFGFLTHKIGPLPAWGWGILAVGVWYWYTHYGPGASAASSTAATDTGDVNANDDSQDTIVQGVSGSHYSTNAEWEVAAINYLVGESVPPDEASAAIYKYLHSQSLSPQERQDVNLAIEGIGPPPKIPAPADQQKPPPHQHPHGHPKFPHEPPPAHNPPPRSGGGNGHGKTGGPPTVKPPHIVQPQPTGGGTKPHPVTGRRNPAPKKHPTPRKKAA